VTAAIHIWADEDGESHLTDLDLDFEPANFLPPAEPVRLTAVTGEEEMMVVIVTLPD
jgi:hypothetical protein